MFKLIKKTFSTWPSPAAGQAISFLTKHTSANEFCCGRREYVPHTQPLTFPNLQPSQKNCSHNQHRLFYVVICSRWSGWRGGGWVGRRLFCQFHCLLVNGIRCVIVWRVNFGRTPSMNRNPTFLSLCLRHCSTRDSCLVPA